MLPNLSKMLHLTRGQKSVIVAYAAVMAIAAGIAIMIMSAADGVYAVPAEPTWFDIWVIIAGGLASCACLLYTSPSPRDRQKSRMPSSA